MPRKNINAREREEKKWSVEYIVSLLKKIKEDNFEIEYVPTISERSVHKKNKDKNKIR